MRPAGKALSTGMMLRSLHYVAKAVISTFFSLVLQANWCFYGQGKISGVVVFVLYSGAGWWVVSCFCFVLLINC